MRNKAAQCGWHGYDLLHCLFFSKAPKISIIALGDHAKGYLATLFQVKKSPLFL